ncbi:MAG: LuxR C-terminal-related transcriptional regulator [Odoribacter sp.]
METKVQQSIHRNNIPAGIFSGIELFSASGRMYAIHQGVRMEYEDLPGTEKRSFVSMYMQDKESQDFIRKQFGCVGFEAGFRQWLFCKFGSLDGDPDSVDEHITPDTYNSACSRTDCPGRGKICGCVAGLKGYEVDTLIELKSGLTTKEAADRLNVSEAAVKSRVEKLKERFNVTNVVALIATITELGI